MSPAVTSAVTRTVTSRHKGETAWRVTPVPPWEPGEDDGDEPEPPVTPVDRGVLLARAERAGYPYLALRPGCAVPEGRGAWGAFVMKATAADLAGASAGLPAEGVAAPLPPGLEKIC